MLSEIRERATGWIAWIIATIIIIPFAFWGVNEYFSGGQEVVVASVDGVDIEQVDYRRALENRRGQMRQLLGESFDPELANSPEFKRGVLEDIISRVLLSRHAEEQGYRVGDRQLAETIRSNPRFQVGEKFSADAYRGALAQMRMTEAGFESQLRQQLMLDQVQSGIRASSFVSPRQERELLELLLQKRRFDYAVMDAERFVERSTVTDDEIRQEYEANSERYRNPEKVKIEFVELSVDEIAETVDVEEEDLQRLYEQNRERFQTDAVRRASHILIEAGADADEQTQQEALNEARGILEQLRGGADFEALARQHSDDPGSAEEGGDLGRVEPGVMVEPFEEALFALQEVGALTEPVRTRFGYHIIKLTEYQSGTIQPFEEVRDELEKEERARRAEALFLDRAEAFRNVSYEQPQSLEPVADQLDLEIQRSDWFSRDDGTGIAANPQVREAAFSPDVFEEGLNSEAIELDINTLVVVRKLDSQPANMKPLEEVRDEIEASLKRRHAEEHVDDLGPELVEQLESGTGWDAVIEEQGVTAREITWSRAEPPGETGPGPQLAEAVFRSPPPDENTPVYGGVSLLGGGYALFRLNEVVPGDPDQAPEELVNRVRNRIARRQSQDMLQQYIADLKDQAEIRIREEHL